MFAIAGDTRLIRKGGKWTEEKNERGAEDGIPLEDGARTINGFDRFVVSGGLGLGDLAVVCLGEDAGMFVDAYVIKVRSFEATDVVEEV